jgi:hypothetical protein
VATHTIPVDISSSDHRPGSAFRTILRINIWSVSASPIVVLPNRWSFCTTNKLVETVDDFVAVQSLLLQHGSTGFNTPRVTH